MPALTPVDALGFAAAFFTLLAFAQRRMQPMRVAALAANLFFIGYGALGSHYPVLALHLLLLPVNLLRFVGDGLFAPRRGAGGGGRPEPGWMSWV